MFREHLNAKGTPTFTLIGDDGVVKHQFTLPNMIVSLGKEWIVKRMAGNTVNPMSHIAIGSGTTPTSIINSTLATETARSTMSVTGGTVSAQIIKFVSTFAPTIGTGSISEAGVFNAASAGTMLSRVVFTPFNKLSTDTLIVEWEIEIV